MDYGVCNMTFIYFILFIYSETVFFIRLSLGTMFPNFFQSWEPVFPYFFFVGQTNRSCLLKYGVNFVAITISVMLRYAFLQLELLELLDDMSRSYQLLDTDFCAQTPLRASICCGFVYNFTSLRQNPSQHAISRENKRIGRGQPFHKTPIGKADTPLITSYPYKSDTFYSHYLFAINDICKLS